MSKYDDFLARKILAAQDHGIEAPPLHSRLFPNQADIVRWSLKKGRAANFVDTGGGKTIMQLEWARHVPGRVLILAPLAVSPQTVKEAQDKLDLEITYARNQLQADMAGTDITVTNYEMLKEFDPERFVGVVLDESSILKSYMGRTKQELIARFRETPFKLACTATPAPNDHMELGNHAEFLGVLGSTEMLARWFINDTMRAGAYRLKRHAEQDFWRWVASWAVCARKPSDVGPYDDSLYNLPPLEIRVEHVEAPGVAERRGQLFAQGDGPSATAMWREKSETALERCQRAADLVTTDRPWLVWCETNEESAMLGKLIPGAVEVKGADSLVTKEARIQGFVEGEFPILISKASICGWGLNFQHCADVVFTGLSYSFESLHQAIRRVWRFGQTRPVTVHLITADSEVGILETVERKRADHERMQDEMVAATRRHGIGSESARPLVKVTPKLLEGEDWQLHIGDNVETIQQIPDNSIGLGVSSLPFSNLYIYSDSLQDMGNSASHAEFFDHMDFLAPELFRVSMPGRLFAWHCKDLPLYMGRDGAAGLYDFPGDVIRCMERAGWTFHSRVTIWKDPVTEMERTKNHGLLHKNFSQRREVVRQGMPDYLIVFRAWKEGMEDRQISGLYPLGRFIGEDAPIPTPRPGRSAEEDYSIKVWQRYASPVWFDINQMRVLQYRQGRCAEDERHICPLQLDVIERCIDLWSNPGETILDPFMGIGSVGYVALETERQVIGCELKESYADVAVRHFEQALMGRRQGALL